MYTIKKIIKYLSYSLVYLIISIASAYGVILLSQSTQRGDQIGAETPLPQQISSMVEHFSSAQALDLNLTADINSASDCYSINLDAIVDLSRGIENVEAAGTITAIINPATAESGSVVVMNAKSTQQQTITIDFNYQNDFVYLDTFGGKMVVQTSSFAQTLTDLLSILDIDLASTGLTDILNMPIKDMLSMLSNIKDESANTENNTIEMTIALPMVGDAFLTCDPTYKLQGLESDMVISEDMTVGVSSAFDYPEEIVIEDKDASEYVNIGNLLDVAKPLATYLKQDKLAFSFNAKSQLENEEYQTLASGKVYLDLANSKARLALDAFGDYAYLHFIDKTVYLEYKNIYTKFNLDQIEQVFNLLERFGIEVPQEIVDTILAALNGEEITLPSGISFDGIDISSLDLSMIEKVEVKDSSTIVTIRDIGVIRIVANEDQLSQLAYSGFGYQASASVIKYADFALTSEETNYIDLALLIPTIENAASIFEEDIVSGQIALKYEGLDLTLDYDFSIKDSKLSAYTNLFGLDINIYLSDNNVYVNVEDKFKFVTDTTTALDDVMAFLNKIGIDITETDPTPILDKLMVFIDPSLTPLFITALNQTENGFALTLLGDTTITAVNGEKTLALNTNICGADVSASVNAGGEVVIPALNIEDFANTNILLDMAAAAYNKGLTAIVKPAYNTIKSGDIGLDTFVTFDKYQIPAKLYFSFSNKTLTLDSEIDGLNLNLFYQDEELYVEFGNVYFNFKLADFQQVETLLARFGITLPTEMIDIILKLITAQSVSTDEILNTFDFDFDLSSLTPSMLDCITMEEGKMTIKIEENVISINFNENEITSIDFNGINASLIDFAKTSLATAKENYINVADFIPTIENAANILENDVVSGSLNTTIDSQLFEIEFAYSQSEQVATAHANIFGIDLNVYVIDGKAYINIEDKFKFVANSATMLEDAKTFLTNIGIDTSMFEELDLEATAKEILNPITNPLLIKSFVKTENGLIITLFNNLALSLVNGSNKIMVSSTVEDMPFAAILTAGGNVVVPEINENEYTDTNILLDMAAAAYNKGLTALVKPALNTFKSGEFGINLTLNAGEYTVEAKANLSLLDKVFSLTSVINNTSLLVLYTDGTIFIEYGNLYFQVAFENYDEISAFLDGNFGIKLPNELIKKAIGLITADSITPDEALNTFDFNLDLSSLTPSMLDCIEVNENDVIATLGENTITLNYTADAITGFSFNSLANGTFVSYSKNTLTTDKANYVELVSFLPTAQNALSIIESDVISGSVAFTIDQQIFNISYAYSQSQNEASVYTQVYGIDLNIYYTDNKVFVNVENKFKFVTDTTTFITDIKAFLASVGVSTDVDTNEILAKVAEILNPAVNSVIIKSVVQTEGGLIITTIGDQVITITNGSATLSIASAVEGINANIVVKAGGNVVIPAINEDEYTDTNILLDMAAAAYNKGLTALVKPALNTFKSGEFGINLTLNAGKYTVEGKANISLLDKVFSLTSVINNTSLLVLYTDGTIFVEYGNLYFQVAFANYDEISAFLDGNFGIKLPNELIKKAIGLITADSITPDEALNTFDFNLDLSSLTPSMLDCIEVNENNVVATLGENTITLNYTADAITGFSFNSLANGTFASYSKNTLTTDKANYVELVSFLPTAQNALDIMSGDTISVFADITLDGTTYEATIYYFQSTNEAIAHVEIMGIDLYVYYTEGSIYINFGDKFKFASTDKTIVDDLKSMLDDFNISTDIDTTAALSEVANVLNPLVNELLIKNFVANDQELQITMFNDIVATITNGDKELTVATTIENIGIKLVINNKIRAEISTDIPAVSEGEYDDLSNLESITSGVANSGATELLKPVINGFYQDNALGGIGGEGEEKHCAIGFDITLNLNDTTIPANLYLSIDNRKLAFVSNINETALQVVYENGVVYVEYGNLYFQVALSDYDKISAFLDSNFGIELPNEMIKKAIDLITADVITPEKALNTFDVDLASLDPALFEGLKVENGVATFSYQGIEAVIYYTEDIITNIEFAYGNAVVTKYVDIKLSTEKANYVKLVSFLPTAQNAIGISEFDIVEGKLLTTVEGQDIEVTFAYAQSKNEAQVSTSIMGINLNIYYSNDKVYVNVHDKFKFITSTETFMDDIETFLAKINLSTNVDVNEILAKVAEVLNPEINTLLIKNFTESANGLAITLFNDMTATIENGANEITLSTTIENIPVLINVKAGENFAELPELVDEQYTDTNVLLDIAAAAYNAGLTNIIEPALNSFASGNIGIDMTITVEDEQIPAELFLSINEKSLALVSEINNTALNIFYQNAIVYAEYGNIYLQVALSDYDSIDNFLASNFGIELPSELIKKAIELLTAEQLTPSQALETFDFNLDLASFDISIFDNITTTDSNIIATLGENIITLDYTAEGFVGFKFDDMLNATFIDYQTKTLTTDTANYVKLVSFLPTAQNAIGISEFDIIEGKLLTTVEGQDIEVTFAYAQSKNEAQVSTSIMGINLNIYYSNDKVYVNVHDKFKFITSTETFMDDIETFLAKINLSADVDVNEILAKVAEVLNPEINTLLIKNFTENANGLAITLFNDMTATIENGANEITLSTTIENIPVLINVKAGEEFAELPELVDEQYTDTNVLLNIIAAAHNAGLTKLVMPAINTLASGNLGATFSFEYEGVAVDGHLSINVADLSVGINVNVRGVNLNIIVLSDDVAYIEFGNVYAKFAFSDFPEMGEIIEKHFGLSIPFGKILEVLSEIRAGTFNPVEVLNKFNIEIDLEAFDLSFFDTIIYQNNTYTLPIEDIGNITLTADENNLLGAGFEGFGIKANGTLNEYEVFDLELLKEEYIDLAQLLPTVDNILDIISHNTLSGQIVIDETAMGLNVPIDYVVSLDSEVYVSFTTSVYGAHISGKYYKEKVYLEFAESVNIIVDVINLPTAIQEVMDSAGKNIQTDDFVAMQDLLEKLVNGETISIVQTAVSMFDNMKSIFDTTAIELLIKMFAATENGWIMTLYDDMVITLENAAASLSAATSISGIDLDITLRGSNDTITIPTLNDSDYIPVENLLELVKAFFNMTHKDDFNIKGTLNIVGTLIGIDITMDVGVEAQIKIVDGKIQAQAILGEIPTILGVNNDVPYKFGDSESGSDRYVYLYFDGDDLYIYRSEYVDLVFGLAGKRQYEKCTKVSADTLLADPMYYLQYMTGFQDSIMGAIEDAMILAQNRENPINLNNVVKSLACSGDLFDLILNLAEIANNPMLDTLDLDLLLAKDSELKSYIYQLGLNVFLPLADIFELTLSSDDIRIVDYGSAVDLSRLQNYVSSYKYNYGEEWEASNGSWEKASDRQYTISFEENGGAEQADITGVYGSPITIPTYTNSITTDDGVAKTTATFAGWYTTANFAEGTQFTATTMPRRDITLFAKWNKNSIYYRTLKFVTNSTQTVDSITALEGSVIVVPDLKTKQETEGDVTTTYSFAGWYTDSTFKTKFTSAYMPSTSTVLYAKWDFVKQEITKTFTLIYNGVTLYTYRIQAGDKIDLSSVNQVDTTSSKPTLFYTDAARTNLYDGDFTMPETDLTLYMKNAYTLTATSAYGNTATATYHLYEGEALSLPSQSNYVVDDGNTRKTYTFHGYSENITSMPSENKSVVANWSEDIKNYYTITFDMSLKYRPIGCAAGATFKTAPPSIASIKVLEGTVIDLTQSKYQVQCQIWGTAFTFGVYYTFRSTTWGTTVNSNASSGGNGFTSYTVTGNATLYPYWEKV